MTPHDWDAETYSRVATGVMALGHETLDRLALRGDETVLDAGCGSGEVTEALARRLPRGRVLAVDASPAMVAAARQRLGDRATVWVCDLRELVLDEPVDAILSTATLHWIADHDALFPRLRAALAPGGRLVVQCGGAGNIAPWAAAIAEVGGRAPFAEHLAGYAPWNFAGPDETQRRLLDAGFAQARCWLIERELDPQEPEAFARAVFLGSHLERLPAALHDAFVHAVLARATFPAPYVRLNVDAAA